MNTPLTSVENERGVPEQNASIENLFDATIDDVYGAGNERELLADIEKNANDFLTRMKVKMKEKRKEGEFSGISENSIDDFSLERANYKVVRRTNGLVESRRRLTYLMKTTYPGIMNVPDWDTKLQGAIRSENKNSLDTLIKSIKSQKRIREFLLLADIQIPDDGWTFYEMQSFEKVFYDIDQIEFSTPGFKEYIKGVFFKHDRFKTIPKSSELRKVLEAYSSVPNERKREILRSLGATFSLGFALEYNLISKEQCYKILTSEYREIFSSLNGQEKEIFLTKFLQKGAENMGYITIDDLDIGESIGGIFQKNELQKISENIIQEIPSVEKGVTENLSNIMKKAVGEFPDEDDHLELFKKYLKKHVRTKEGTEIVGIDFLGVNGVIEFEDVDGNTQFIQIIQTHSEKGMPLDVEHGEATGIMIQELPVSEGAVRKGGIKGISWDVLYGFFSSAKTKPRILSQNQFKDKITQDETESKNGEKLYDARDIDVIDAKTIKFHIDKFDSKGTIYGFEPGTYFEAPEEEKEGKSQNRIWKVVSLDEGGANILSESGTRTDYYDYSVFISLSENGRLKRINKIQSDQDLIRELINNAGVDTTAGLDDGIIHYDAKDEDGKSIKKHFRAFKSKKDGHIRVDGIRNGLVTFGEYIPDTEEHKVSEYAKKHGERKAYEAFYKPKIMTYGAFIEYIKNEELTASTDDIIDVHAHDHHDHDHSHMHSSLLSKLGKMQSFHSMWKGLELVWHSLEHTLEKGAKLDAARFAMKISKFIPLDSVEAQIYADIVDGSKETVEKYKNKIANLPGPKGRWKCIHIAHNADARPEEVMAAIQFMVSSYGHLYAEDIKHYQSVVTRDNLAHKPVGYFAFLDAFILSTQMPEGVMHWRQKAYDKAKQELGNEGEPPEEQLIHGLFKSIDGNPEKYPYAASVVKAIGGPGGFEKDWKFEGTKNAMQKGRDQTTMVNAQGRLNKAIGYLTTHEFYKAIGGMEKVAGKIKVPSYQALPFVWAVGGYSKYASPTSLQEIKNYAEQGFSFHAYGFMRKYEDNMIYRETVRLAIMELESQGKMKPGSLSQFNEICQRLDHGPEDTEITDKKYGKISPPKAMANFWQDNCNTGLHDILQGNGGWIMKKVKDKNPVILQYKNLLHGAHDNALKNANVPTSGNGAEWYEEHGLGMNLIFRTIDDGKYQSLRSSLNKIKLLGPNRGGKPMNEDHESKIWNYLVKEVQNSRESTKFGGDKKLQKEQYMIWRQELIDYFAEQLSAATISDNSEQVEASIRQYKYFRDFEKMGIDPRVVFYADLIEKNAESDYQAWLDGGRVSKDTSSLIDRIRKESYIPKVTERNAYRDTDDTGGYSRSFAGADLTDSD